MIPVFQNKHQNHNCLRDKNNFSDNISNYFGDIPLHWQVKRLQFVSRKIQTGTTPPTSNEEYYENGTIDWFAPSDFLGNQIHLKEAKKKINKKVLQDGIVKYIPKGSILIIGIGATLGKVGLLDIDATSNQQINAIILSDDVEPKFVAYHLSVSQEIMKVISNATTIGILNQEKTRLIPLAIPPIYEQKLIADYLDRETTEIDNLIAEKEKMLALLEEKREALISRAVTCGLDSNVSFKRSGIEWLGEVPEHWNLQRVKHSFEITLGKMLDPTPRNNSDIEVPYLKALHIHWDRVKFQNLPTMWANKIEIQNLELKQGDLLVCEGGDVGRATILKTKLPLNSIIQNSVHRVRSKESGENRFLRYLLRHASVKGVLDVVCNKATIGHFTVEKFREFWIAAPTKAEQKLIADFLDLETAKINKLLAAIKESIALLKERRSALITAAVTGQISIEEMTT